MKKKYFKQIGFLVLLTILFIALKTPKGWLDNKLYTTLQEQLEPLGAKIEAEKFSYNFPIGVSLYNGGMLLPTKPIKIPIGFESLNLHLKTLSLFLLKLSIIGDVNLYGGRIETNAKKSFFSNNTDINLNLSNIKLNKHPLGKLYQTSGDIFNKAKIILNNKNADPITSLNAEIEIKNGSYQGEYKLFELIKIPQVSNLFLKSSIKKNGKELSIKLEEVNCSLGKASGETKFTIDRKNFFISGTNEYSLSLTNDGHKEIGTYLALQAQEPLTTEKRNWKIFSKFEGNKIIKLNIEAN